MIFKQTLIIGTLLVTSACTSMQSDPDQTGLVDTSSASSSNTSALSSAVSANTQDVLVTPISHATMVLDWQNTILYTDPVGGAEAFASQPDANLILLTDIHGDHLDTDTLSAVTQETTVLIAPQAVYDELPPVLQEQTLIVDNDQTIIESGFSITAIPMYNLPVTDDSRHVKGRGNGYIVEKANTRVYISGDSADIPEMRALEDIDIAFIAMNEPYTMGPIAAADAVAEFAPAKVYPYHYREPDGFADVAQFASIVQSENPEIEVVQLNWYADAE